MAATLQGHVIDGVGVVGVAVVRVRDSEALANDARVDFRQIGFTLEAINHKLQFEIAGLNS